jgi:hypothetical protein
LKAAEARDYQLPFSEEELERLWQSASSPRGAISMETRGAFQALHRLVAEVRRLRGAASLLQYHHAMQGVPCSFCDAYRQQADQETQRAAVEEPSEQAGHSLR